MISLRQINKSYGKVRAVARVSFDVAEGENLVLLGTSGCGKTTTLKMINRLVTPDSGQVLVNGMDAALQPPETLRRHIGYVLQHNSLFPHYTVAENIAVAPHLLKWEKQKIKARTDELLDLLHLSVADLHKYPQELSGGQQQRVNIARALAADPPILLMDEPFGALDPITRQSIAGEFSRIEAFMHKTMVMVTHDVQEAFLLGNRICLMNGGEIMQIGEPKELLFRPANDFVREFFAGSYLRLALGITKITDVWSLLDDSEATTAAPEIGGDENLWAVMELVAGNRAVQVVNVRNERQQVKSVTREDIFNVFSKYTTGQARV